MWNISMESACLCFINEWMSVFMMDVMHYFIYIEINHCCTKSQACVCDGGLVEKGEIYKCICLMFKKKSFTQI